MAFPVNRFGIPQYPQGDARRLLVLASAVDLLERPSASALADLTGIDISFIDDDMEKLREQYGLVIHKFGEVFRIESWGDVLKREGALKAMKQAE